MKETSAKERKGVKIDPTDTFPQSNTLPYKVIEPPVLFNPFHEIGEVWHHRELLYLLAWRDYKVRYRQTVIGIAWAIFQPVVAMIAFVFIFGRFDGIADNKIPYALFVYSGLVIWQFFSNSVSDASSSLVDARQMITKIYFPRIIVPLAKIVTQFIDLAISMVVLGALMIFFHVLPSPLGILYLIPIFTLLGIVSASIGVILSAINVKYRDVQYALPFFIQIGLFLSPVIYAGANLGKYQKLLSLNPITGIIEAFRSALFSLQFSPSSLFTSCLITLLLFLVGMYYFIKSEGAFSDVI
jgi:lipopolysaccharide transport system permease protein